MEKSSSKICVITTVHPPFDTRIFHKEIKSLSSAGYSVTLIAPHQKDETVEGVRIESLSLWKGRLLRGRSSIKAFGIARSGDFDAFHFHDPEFLPFAALLKIFTRKPVIYDVHEDYPNSIRDKDWIPKPARGAVARIFEIIEPIFLKFMDAVVYTTPIIGARYSKAKKSIRAENYPPLEAFNRLTATEADTSRFVFTGSISRPRGIFELLEAFRILLSKYPEANLDLLGWFRPISLESEARQRIETLGIGERLRIMEGIPYREIGGFLSGALGGMVTFLPMALHNTTSLPNKLFEYMAAGIPVIASDFPLYREVLEGAGCGILVDPGRPNEIAKAMTSLIEDRAIASEMGRSGRKAFEEKYNWNSEGEKLVALYDELLGCER